MKKRKKRRGISLGTWLMLLLTAVVMMACVTFVWMIAGDGLYEKTGAFIRSLSERGLFEETPIIRDAAVPTTASASFLMEETPAPAMPSVTPVPRPEQVSLTISAAGTVYAPKAVRESVQSGTDHFDFAPVFKGLGNTLSASDLAIATLETTTAGADRGFDNYNTAPEILDGLRACGIDLLSLATEHALDKGYDGLDLTVSDLTARGLNYAGVYPDGAGSARATMLSIGGVNVAVLAYAYGLSDEGVKKTDGDRLGALAPATTNIARPSSALYAGIAYSAYSSSLEQITTMSAPALTASSTPSSTVAKPRLSITLYPAQARKLHENWARA